MRSAVTRGKRGLWCKILLRDFGCFYFFFKTKYSLRLNTQINKQKKNNILFNYMEMILMKNNNISNPNVNSFNTTENKNNNGDDFMEKLTKKEFKNLSKTEGYNLYTIVCNFAEDMKIDLDKAWELFEQAKFDADEALRLAKEAKALAKEAEADAKKAEADAKKAKADAKKAKADAKKSKADAKKSEARADKAEARADKAEADAKKSEARADKAEARAQKAEADAEKAKADAKEGQDAVKKINNCIDKLKEDAKTYDSMASRFDSERRGFHNFQRIHGKEIKYAKKRIEELKNKLKIGEGNKFEILAELKVAETDLKHKEESYAYTEEERRICETAGKRALKEANSIRNGQLKEAEQDLETIQNILAKY